MISITSADNYHEVSLSYKKGAIIMDVKLKKMQPTLSNYVVVSSTKRFRLQWNKWAMKI